MNAAAPHLGMTASAVSQAVRKLEAHYGVKLLNRTTRSLSPTAEGRQLQQYARQLADWHDTVEREMGVLQAEGEVRLSLPTGYSATLPMQNTVLTLRRRFPNIRLVLTESNRMADLQHDTDIAVRAVLPPRQPRQRGAPACPVADADCRRALKHLGLPDTLPQNRTDCPDSSLAAREFARAGMGLAVLLSGDTAPFIKDGSLTVVLPDHKLPARTLYAATAHRTQSAKVQVVLGECFGG